MIKSRKSGLKKIVGIFSFDGPLYKDRDGIYCNMTVTNKMLSRYFFVVDELVVIMRTFNLDKTYREANLKKLELKHIQIYEMGNIVSPSGLVKKNQYTKELQKLVKEADLFFLRLPSISSNMIGEICNKQGKPYLVEVGGCAWDSFWNHSMLGKMCAPYMYIQERKCVKNAHYATYVTEKWLQNRYPSRCESISASNVYLPQFEKSTLQRRLNKIEEFDKRKRCVIGTTAAVNVRYKGQEYIIKAISILKKKGIHIEYELVGAGEHEYLRGIARKYGVADQIKFCGIMLHEDVIDWLDSIDIYGQPSRQEGLPRALIEAMSRGLPSIGSTTAGIPELLEKDYVFDNGDVEQICNILLRLMNVETMKKLAKRNYKKAQEYEFELIDQRRRDYFRRYAHTVLEE